MGHHYVPQAYLRRFCSEDTPGLLWQFDKKTARWACASVKKVAQQSQFYSPEVEARLNAVVEGPANTALKKLDRAIHLEQADRQRLAFYIATMLKRVPQRRIDGLKRLPSVLDETIDEIKHEIEVILEDWPGDRELGKGRLIELEELRERFREAPPADVLEELRVPWPSAQMVAAILQMTWRFVQTSGPSYFLTTDNPAFFFEAYGLATEKSELTFPISSKLALAGSWQHGPEQTYVDPRQQIVKELNRRVASKATRFLYYQERVSWIESLAQKEQPYLSRILW